MVDERLRQKANRRINQPHLPFDPTNPYDRATPPMRPPPPRDSVDTISVADMSATDLSSTYAGNWRRESSIISDAVSTTPRGRKRRFSQRTQPAQDNELSRQENELERDLIQLRHQVKIQNMQKEKEKLLQELQS